MLRGRRTIIAAAAAAVAGGVLATTALGRSNPTPPARCAAGQVDGDLELLNWSEYIDPALIDQFEATTGVTVIEEFFGTNEEALDLIAEPGSTYDIVVPSDYLIPALSSSGLVQALEQSAIPNLVNLSTEFTELSFDPDGRFSVPYQWGTTGLAVDLEAVGGDVDPSWSLIFDPAVASEFSGRITLLSGARETMGAALKYLGYSLNTTNPREIAAAAELLRDAAPLLHSFEDDDFENLLLDGEADIVMGFSGDVLALIAEVAASDPAAADRYRYFVPEEGGVQWIDNMVIPSSSEHPCTAHAFINFILDAQNGAALSNYNFYASPNRAAEPFLDPAILSDPAVYPPVQTAARLEVVEDLGPDLVIYENAMAEVVAAADPAG